MIDKSQPILICGASGLTGRNLFNYFEISGYNTVGTYHSKKIHNLIQCDFTDKKQTDELFTKVKPSHVFICCAKTYNLSTCAENPQSMMLPNINMVGNIMSACTYHNVKGVLYISSATVYQPSFKPMSEEDIDLNKDPYGVYMSVGWVKRYLEKLCAFYGEFMPVYIVRPTNIYGPYDKTDMNGCHLVPAVIMRCLNGENPFLFKGTGNAVKDMIYVQDLVTDLERIMFSRLPTNTFNVCSGNVITLNDIVRKTIDSCGHNPAIYFSKDQESVPYIALLRNKLDSILGKRNYVKFEDGIKETVRWYYSLRQTRSA